MNLRPLHLLLALLSTFGCAEPERSEALLKGFFDGASRYPLPEYALKGPAVMSCALWSDEAYLAPEGNPETRQGATQIVELFVEAGIPVWLLCRKSASESNLPPGLEALRGLIEAGKVVLIPHQLDAYADLDPGPWTQDYVPRALADRKGRYALVVTGYGGTNPQDEPILAVTRSAVDALVAHTQLSRIDAPFQMDGAMLTLLSMKAKTALLSRPGMALANGITQAADFEALEKAVKETFGLERLRSIDTLPGDDTYHLDPFLLVPAEGQVVLAELAQLSLMKRLIEMLVPRLDPGSELARYLDEVAQLPSDAAVEAQLAATTKALKELGIDPQTLRYAPVFHDHLPPRKLRSASGEVKLSWRWKSLVNVALVPAAQGSGKVAIPQYQAQELRPMLEALLPQGVEVESILAQIDEAFETRDTDAATTYVSLGYRPQWIDANNLTSICGAGWHCAVARLPESGSRATCTPNTTARRGRGFQ